MGLTVSNQSIHAFQCKRTGDSYDWIASSVTYKSWSTCYNWQEASWWGLLWVLTTNDIFQVEICASRRAGVNISNLVFEYCDQPCKEPTTLTISVSDCSLKRFSSEKPQFDVALQLGWMYLPCQFFPKMIRYGVCLLYCTGIWELQGWKGKPTRQYLCN